MRIIKNELKNECKVTSFYAYFLHLALPSTSLTDGEAITFLLMTNGYKIKNITNPICCFLVKLLDEINILTINVINKNQ